MEQPKAMEHGSRKASPDVLKPHMYINIFVYLSFPSVVPAHLGHWSEEGIVNDGGKCEWPNFELLSRHISILGRGGGYLFRRHFRNDTASQPMPYSMFPISVRLKRPELETEHYPRFHDVHGHREVVVYSLGATELFCAFV